MRRFLRWLFTPFIMWYMRRYTARPNRERIFEALSTLYAAILKGNTDKGLVIPFDLQTGRFIIFSDHHKGSGNGADDFMLCCNNYLSALDYYYDNGYHYIALGDTEELWENWWPSVKKAQAATFEKEARFVPKNAFIKIFGNHDLFWDNDPFAPVYLKSVFGTELTIHEGVVLQTEVGGETIHIFCTHGHQGDEVSDGNWFSKFFVSRIWAPFQAYLKMNPNTPANDTNLKTLHNSLMYEWSAQQKNLLLVTGHTHQPVFESLTHLERLYRQLLFARQNNDGNLQECLQQEIVRRQFEYNNISEDYLKLKPSYFNAGCCCYNDGDITGIEIEQHCFRLVKWHSKEGKPVRIVLEESPIQELLAAINK